MWWLRVSKTWISLMKSPHQPKHFEIYTSNAQHIFLLCVLRCACPYQPYIHKMWIDASWSITQTIHRKPPTPKTTKLAGLYVKWNKFKLIVRLNSDFNFGWQKVDLALKGSNAYLTICEMMPPVQFGFRWNCWIQNVNHSELPSTAHFITHQWWHRTLFNIMQNSKFWNDFQQARYLWWQYSTTLLLTFAERFGQMNSIFGRCFIDCIYHTALLVKWKMQTVFFFFAGVKKLLGTIKWVEIDRVKNK